MPGVGKKTDNWSAEAKLAAVIETAALSETQLSEYCRAKGLYPEQIKAWKAACIRGQYAEAELTQQAREQSKRDKKEIHDLKRELQRKNNALAETAALLALRKKLTALWGESEDK